MTTSPALLGEVVAWDLASCEVPFSRVREALAAAGLSPDLAADLAAKTAFRRALASFREDRAIDQLKDAPEGAIVFQFTRKHLEESRIEFAYETTVTLHVARGEIDCPNEQIADHAREMFDHALGHRTTSDITRLVQSLFQSHADLMPLVPRKGVAYFVPDRFRDFTAKVQAFLHSMGGKLCRMPVPAGTPEGNRSVKDAVEDGLSALAAELDESVEAWNDKTRSSTFENAAERWRQIRHKAEAYSEYLADRQTAILDRLEETKRKIAERVVALSEAKDDPAERPLLAEATA